MNAGLHRTPRKLACAICVVVVCLCVLCLCGVFRPLLPSIVFCALRHRADRWKESSALVMLLQ